MNGIKHLSSRLDDKRRVIFGRLQSNPPTIVLPRREGIYVFSSNIAKVHSTILLAGVGLDFINVEIWYRKQLEMLIDGWSANVPKAAIDIRMLPSVFRVNIEDVRNLLYADLVLIEVCNKVENDFIARVDPTGDVTVFSGGKDVVICYGYRARLNLDENSHNSSIEDEDDEEKRREIEEERREKEEEIEKERNKDLATVGIESVEELGNEEVLRRLIDDYPGKKSFLSREKLNAKEFNWIHRIL